MIKDELLRILWDNADHSISGAELARRLSVSRAAVWKAMEQLRAEGYLIESATRRGYRLSSRSDVLSAAGIERHLRREGLRLEVYPSLSSTNTLLKERAAQGAGEGLVLVAGEQTGGRGRMGRGFYSPPGTGLYLSVLLRPRMPAAEATALTACAAVAVAESIEALSGKAAQIKWVNDVLIGGKKVCGILTEASLDCESSYVNYAVVGIGINALSPDGGFPPELGGVAGAVFDGPALPELRCRLAAELLDRLMGYAAELEDKRFFPGYKSRSLVLGKAIHILSPGREPEAATALDLEPDFALLVRTGDGQIKRLQSGEVSIRPQDGLRF